MMGEIRPLPMKKGETSLKIARNRHFHEIWSLMPKKIGSG
jgi:hypothetical protein